MTKNLPPVKRRKVFCGPACAKSMRQIGRHYSIITSFVTAFSDGDLTTGVIHIIDKILLALMVAEIFYTVIISFKSYSLKSEPFIIVGLIASIRRVLLISLEAAHLKEPSQQQLFYNYMIELGLLTVLIFVFVISIYFLRKHERREETKQ